MIIRDVGTIDVAYQILDQNLQRIRQMIDARQICDVVIFIILAVHLQGASWSSRTDMLPPSFCGCMTQLIIRRLRYSQVNLALACLLEVWDNTYSDINRAGGKFAKTADQRSQP